jgi:hypothetical protein
MQVDPIKRNEPGDTIEKAEMRPEGFEDIVQFFGEMIAEDKHPGAQLTVYR